MEASVNRSGKIKEGTRERISEPGKLERGISMPSHIACAVQSCAASRLDDAVDPF